MNIRSGGNRNLKTKRREKESATGVPRGDRRKGRGRGRVKKSVRGQSKEEENL